MKTVETIVLTVLDAKAHKATKYISPRLVIRATQRMYHRKVKGTRENAKIVLTIGRPNYSERKFIATLKKAGEPFPVKKIQLKYPPKARAA